MGSKAKVKFQLSLVLVMFCLASHLCGAQTNLGPQVQALGTASSLGLNAGSLPTGIPQVQAVSAVPEDFSKLKIAPGFLLSVQVLDEPEASGSFRVEGDGNISIPLGGQLQVYGLTTAQAQSVISDRLKDNQILRNPQVTVSILQYAPFLVTVLGEVQRPGRIELLSPHPLEDVLAAAGGETQLAGGVVRVERFKDGLRHVDTYPYRHEFKDSAHPDLLLEQGDILTVPRAGIVYILGAVLRPGGYLMQEYGDLNLAQGLSLALGTTMQAKVSEIKIVRRDPNTHDILTTSVDYKAVMTGKIPAPKLQAEDIVYVPVSKLKTVFTTGSYALSAAATSTVYAIR